MRLGGPASQPSPPLTTPAAHADARTHPSPQRQAQSSMQTRSHGSRGRAPAQPGCPHLLVHEVVEVGSLRGVHLQGRRRVRRGACGRRGAAWSRAASRAASPAAALRALLGTSAVASPCLPAAHQ